MWIGRRTWGRHFRWKAQETYQRKEYKSYVWTASELTWLEQKDTNEKCKNLDFLLKRILACTLLCSWHRAQHRTFSESVINKFFSIDWFDLTPMQHIFYPALTLIINEAKETWRGWKSELSCGENIVGHRFWETRKLKLNKNICFFWTVK